LIDLNIPIPPIPFFFFPILPILPLTFASCDGRTNLAASNSRRFDARRSPGFPEGHIREYARFFVIAAFLKADRRSNTDRSKEGKEDETHFRDKICSDVGAKRELRECVFLGKKSDGSKFIHEFEPESPSPYGGFKRLIRAMIRNTAHYF
jgi:hypothetical protein